MTKYEKNQKDLGRSLNRLQRYLKRQYKKCKIKHNTTSNTHYSSRTNSSTDMLVSLGISFIIAVALFKIFLNREESSFMFFILIGLSAIIIIPYIMAKIIMTDKETRSLTIKSLKSTSLKLLKFLLIPIFIIGLIKIIGFLKLPAKTFIIIILVAFLSFPIIAIIIIVKNKKQIEQEIEEKYIIEEKIKKIDKKKNQNNGEHQ